MCISYMHYYIHYHILSFIIQDYKCRPADSPISSCMKTGISAEFRSHQTVVNVAGVGNFADASIQSGLTLSYM